MDYIVKFALYENRDGIQHNLNMAKPVTLAHLLIFIIRAKLSRKKYGKSYVEYCEMTVENGSVWIECIDQSCTNKKDGVNDLQMRNVWGLMECKNKRGKKNVDRIKFFTCKKCRIASYCSRLCVQIDCKLYYDFATHNHKYK